MLAWGLGNLSLGYYLFGKYRDPQPAKPTMLAKSAAGFRPAVHDDDNADATRPDMQPGRLPPEACHTLAGFIYKTFQVAVLLLAAGTILGGLWADVSWGRFWGWDPKEVWALVSLLAYLAILHGRYAGLFGDFGLAAGSVLGASAIVFSWYGVNFVLGAGLHSYGFGKGGQGEVFSAVAINWLFLGIAAFRYRLETQGKPRTPNPTAAQSATKEEVAV
jgi:ABC-type transport system involved in cytochrome c biogenesis permease subunit